MVNISRLLASLGEITGRPNRRWPLRRPALELEELEGRVVPTLLGQQLFPADYPWNQNIANAPVAANSAAVITQIGSAIHIHPDWGDDRPSNGNAPLYGIPFNVVHGNSTPKVNVTIDLYPGESDIVPVPIPTGAVIEGDYQNGPNPNGPGNTNINGRGDSHLLIWDEDNNIAYELYGAARPTDPDTMAGGPTGGVWHAAQESVWDMKTDNFRTLGYTSADAAGLSILAGLARPDEGLPVALGGQGVITHALRFTLPAGDVNPQYVYPAAHVVGGSLGAANLPFGARLRLMNTPAVNAMINTLGPEAQIIARAMQQYGLVLADIGSAMYVTGTSASENANNQINFTWDMNDVLGLRALTAGDFQVVDLTPRVTGLSLGTGPAGSTLTVIGQNFSGAAGHLTVYFGNTAASSVTYVDDSHLRVVVPNGSGTVNVRVQSGVPETDPNNPADNVNNPIFGYGISALSAADQFTYGGTPTPPAPPPTPPPPTPAPSLPASIRGVVFNDQNVNGVQDASEPGLAGQTVFVDLYGSGVLQPGDPSAVPDAYGNYQLTVPSPGTYLVRQTLSSGVLLSAPASGSYLVTVGSGATLTGENFADVVTSIAVPLTLPPSTPFPAQGDPNADYVEAVYRAVLDRNADPAGLASWTSQLARGAVTRLQVVQGIRNSTEHFTQEVEEFYQTLLGRAADPQGLQMWVQQLQNGMREEQVAFDFLDSPEYLSRGDKYFIDAMYQSLLGRSFDPVGEAAWLGQLGDDASGSPTHAATITHEQVISDFLYSAESETRLTEGYYEVFLHRPADQAGLSSWLAQLQKGAPFLTIGQEFLASDEFYNRAAQQG
jgi:hypothetical protein